MTHWRLEDMSEKQRSMIQSEAPDKNRVASKATNVESSSCNEQVPKKEVEGHNGSVSIVVTQTRKRLTDSDGACFKYVLDGIVSAGILQDDNPSIIPQSPSKTQIKGEPEKTVIDIYEMEDN